MDDTRFDDLTAALEEVNAAAPAAAALFDYQTGQSWSFHGERWFHAASTIKIAVLACTYTALQERGLTPSHLLQCAIVSSAQPTAAPTRSLATRDSDPEVYTAIGRTMRIGDLARHMITVSSNLATNVLVDFVGVPVARRILADAGISGVDLVRGVEDDRAFDAGISNRVTADGLVRLLRAILEGRFGSDGACRRDDRHPVGAGLQQRHPGRAAAGRPRRRRGSPTRPARSPPRRTTPASSSCPAVRRMSLPS